MERARLPDRRSAELPQIARQLSAAKVLGDQNQQIAAALARVELPHLKDVIALPRLDLSGINEVLTSTAIAETKRLLAEMRVPLPKFEFPAGTPKNVIVAFNTTSGAVDLREGDDEEGPAAPVASVLAGVLRAIHDAADSPRLANLLALLGLLVTIITNIPQPEPPEVVVRPIVIIQGENLSEATLDATPATPRAAPDAHRSPTSPLNPDCPPDQSREHRDDPAREVGDPPSASSSAPGSG